MDTELNSTGESKRNSLLGTYLPLVSGLVLAILGAVIGFAEMTAEGSADPVVSAIATILALAAATLFDRVKASKVAQKLEEMRAEAIVKSGATPVAKS